MAVVIELRPVDRRDLAHAAPVRDVGIVRGDRVLLDHVGVRPPEVLGQIALPVGRLAVGDVELAVAGEVRVEREPEQALLVELRPLRGDPVGEIEERIFQDLAVRAQNPDQAALLGDEAAIVACRLHHHHGCGQTRCRLLQIDRNIGMRWRPAGRQHDRDTRSQTPPHRRPPCCKVDPPGCERPDNPGQRPTLRIHEIPRRTG